MDTGAACLTHSPLPLLPRGWPMMGTVALSAGVNRVDTVRMPDEGRNVGSPARPSIGGTGPKRDISSPDGFRGFEADQMIGFQPERF